MIGISVKILLKMYKIMKVMAITVGVGENVIDCQVHNQLSSCRYCDVFRWVKGPFGGK